MGIFISLLTFLLLVDCAILILLVLVQLPKKEAGLGQAFGASTTDALFGPGSGNVLTKLTKFGIGAFFVLIMLISILQGQQAKAKSADYRSRLTSAEKSEGLPVPKPAVTVSNAAGATAAASNALATATSNAPAVPTNAAAPK